jgi:hypothetical protein
MWNCMSAAISGAISPSSTAVTRRDDALAFGDGRGVGAAEASDTASGSMPSRSS